MISNDLFTNQTLFMRPDEISPDKGQELIDLKLHYHRKVNPILWKLFYGWYFDTPTKSLTDKTIQIWILIYDNHMYVFC